MSYGNDKRIGDIGSKLLLGLLIGLIIYLLDLAGCFPKH